MLNNIGSVPLITVGVLTCNHEKYILECLRSIVEQKGNFACNVIVIDDNSYDNTQTIIEGFVSDVTDLQNFRIEYIRNETCLGKVESFKKALNLIEKSGCDYFTFCEGDSRYLTDNRLEAHLALHRGHPELVFSFNKFRQFYREENRAEVYSPNFGGEKLSAERLIEENIPIPLCSSFYCSDVLQTVNDGLFANMRSTDWLFPIYCSSYGDIGYIDVSMSLCANPLKKDRDIPELIEEYRAAISAISKYNEYFEFTYNKEFELLYSKYTEALLACEAPKTYDLVVIDNLFPHPLSGFSYCEFTNLITSFKNGAVYSTGLHSSFLGKDPAENILVNYKRKYPELSDRVWHLDNTSCFQAKLLYGIFLNTAYGNLLYWSEKLKTPFAFTLYPGGGFMLNDEQSDNMLRAVFSSEWFRKVIVTQQITYDYLTDNELCDEENIEFIFGVVTDDGKLNKQPEDKRHFGINKETLDICFVAHKYTETGVDKGYDLFIEAAKLLSRRYENIRFHVVGPWTKDVIDIAGIKNIFFYGTRPSAWFAEFYTDKDIIISANINGVLSKGSFDGFPTTSVTDAALCEVAMFCTDPLGLNNGKFEDKKEIIILEHSAENIVKNIEYYYKRPVELLELSKNGKVKSEYVYSYENQMVPRINLLSGILNN